MIRAAQPADAGWIAALWNRSIADSDVTFTTVLKDAGEVAAMIAARPGAFLAAPQKGFATYGAFRGGPGYAATVEHTLYVDPAAQGQGIGRALMDALETRARAAGVHVMVAGISGTNPAAIAFHAQLGFVQGAHLPEVGRKDGRWLDLILMTKIL